MKKLLLSIVIVFGISITISYAQGPTVGDFFPVKDVVDLEGNVVSTADLLKNDGKPVVIDFWATWCKPCLLSIKEMHEHYDEWKEETGVNIILVTIDEERLVGKVKHVQELKQWKFDMYRDADFKLKRSLGWSSVPQTYLLDETGKILYHSSEGGHEDKLYKEIKKAAK